LLCALASAYLTPDDSLDDVFFLLPECLLLAQADGPPPGQDGQVGPMSWLFPMAVIVFLFYFMMIRPQKRREQEHRQMIENLKENDRVVTIGGIYGVVTNVQRDAERLTIRVDEATGAKLKVGMSAIARVISGDESENGGAASKS
jgi:preprotein translocase subunit YajC